MFDRPPTSAQRLLTASDIGRAAGLNHVYVGNLRGSGGETTLCPSCSRVLIERSGFLVVANHLTDGRCPQCRRPVAGVWK